MHSRSKNRQITPDSLSACSVKIWRWSMWGACRSQHTLGIQTRGSRWVYIMMQSLTLSTYLQKRLAIIHLVIGEQILHWPWVDATCSSELFFQIDTAKSLSLSVNGATSGCSSACAPVRTVCFHFRAPVLSLQGYEQASSEIMTVLQISKVKVRRNWCSKIKSDSVLLIMPSEKDCFLSALTLFVYQQRKCGFAYCSRSRGSHLSRGKKCHRAGDDNDDWKSVLFG